MKQKIHPTWHSDAVVKCACGNEFTTGSTQEVIEVDICSACHPFFTGEMKFVDRQGRVDKFQKKVAAAQAAKQQKTAKKSKKSDKQAEQKSYRELLREQKDSLRETSSAA